LTCLADRGIKQIQVSTRYPASCATSCSSSGTIELCDPTCAKDNGIFVGGAAKPGPAESLSGPCILSETLPSSPIAPSKECDSLCHGQKQAARDSHTQKEVACEDPSGPFPVPKAVCPMSNSVPLNTRCASNSSLFALHGRVENLILLWSALKTSCVLDHICVIDVVCRSSSSECPEPAFTFVPCLGGTRHDSCNSRSSWRSSKTRRRCHESCTDTPDHMSNAASLCSPLSGHQHARMHVLVCFSQSTKLSCCLVAC
jgi:hypothetical protein